MADLFARSQAPNAVPAWHANLWTGIKLMKKQYEALKPQVPWRGDTVAEAIEVLTRWQERGKTTKRKRYEGSSPPPKKKGGGRSGPLREWLQAEGFRMGETSNKKSADG
jgi:hypothetical protein